MLKRGRYSTMPPTYPKDVRMVYTTKRGDRYTLDMKLLGRHDKLEMYDIYTRLLESSDVVKVQYLHLKDGIYKPIDFSNVLRAIFDTPVFKGSSSKDFKESVIKILDNAAHKVVV